MVWGRVVSMTLKFSSLLGRKKLYHSFTEIERRDKIKIGGKAKFYFVCVELECDKIRSFYII